MSTTQPITSLSSSAIPFLLTSGEHCPLCDQVIPSDRVGEINSKLEANQHELTSTLTAQLEARFARDHARALEEVQQEGRELLARERQIAEARLQAAREAERCAAEVSAERRIAEARAQQEETQAALRCRAEAAEAATIAAEQSGAQMQGRIQQLCQDNASEIESIRREAAANEAAIHHNAELQAQAKVRDQINELEKKQTEAQEAAQARERHAQADLAAAEQGRLSLAAELEQVRLDAQAMLTRAAQESAEREAAAQILGRTTAEAELQERLDHAEHLKAEADASAAANAAQLETAKVEHQTDLVGRLAEQREALEKAQTDAVNAVRAEAIEDKMKLSNKLEEAQRALDKKRAEELGEAAEMDLFEELKKEFESDRIERIGRGNPGADIRHVVIHNGQECGTILYDSKDHGAWRYEFVTKLASDQMADKADHAILFTRKFPTNKSQLFVHDGVIVASPARATALVQIVRQHIIASHTLRFGEEARAHKTQELYAFMCSDRFSNLIARIDANMEKLLTLQEKEQKAHKILWQDQSKLMRATQKVQAEICNEIDSIIGTAERQERAAYE